MEILYKDTFHHIVERMYNMMISVFQIPLEAVKKTNLGHFVMNFALQPVYIHMFYDVL